MRTTLTLDDDVAFGLKRVQDADPDRSFKQIVNDLLRNGLNGSRPVKKRPFKVTPMKLGLRDGLNIDNIEELLDIVEGPMRR